MSVFESEVENDPSSSLNTVKSDVASPDIDVSSNRYEDTDRLLNNSAEPPMDGWHDVNRPRYGAIQHVVSCQSISAEYERTEDAEGILICISVGSVENPTCTQGV